MIAQQYPHLQLQTKYAATQNTSNISTFIMSPSKQPEKRPRLPNDVHNFSPEFYDRLPKIWLTRRALRELNYRNRTRRIEIPTTHYETLPSLSRFARQGGPDLKDIRGVRLIRLVSTDRISHVV